MTDIAMNNYMEIRGRVMKYPLQKKDEFFLERSVVDSWFLGSLLEREATRRNQERLYFKVVEDGKTVPYKATFEEQDFNMVLANIAEIRGNKSHYVYVNPFLT